MPLAAHVLPDHLAPTADLPHTFVEHEDLKAILLAGQKHFDIETVCDVRAGKGSAFMRTHFPVTAASAGNRQFQAALALTALEDSSKDLTTFCPLAGLNASVLPSTNNAAVVSPSGPNTGTANAVTPVSRLPSTRA